MNDQTNTNPLQKIQDILSVASGEKGVMITINKEDMIILGLVLFIGMFVATLLSGLIAGKLT